LLSKLCGPAGAARVSGVVADAEGRGAIKNISQDTATSPRPRASARSRSRSLTARGIRQCHPKDLSSLRQKAEPSSAAQNLSRLLSPKAKSPIFLTLEFAPRPCSLSLGAELAPPVRFCPCNV